ncbi:LysR family transcriptional regulator [Paenibacillus sp. HB172176]|uniref:LysR family transcriptional regulator n=1 Tax=Paenibacillus sp. HB172176 TaxID=2493690 RepID=UPI00143A3785|nr:LysR family transcriptional regulator [Paenibacillus sp. HB172176]
MNIQQLKVFIEMCSGRTLAEAAERLGLKQPTASFHLRKLEEELGMELFRKQSRSLQPNDASAELLPYARRIVFLMEEARDTMKALQSEEYGRLRLGSSYTPATYVMPPYFAAYRERYPKVSFTLVVKQAETALGMLRNYEIDAAIVSLGSMEAEGLIIHPLLPDELKLLLSPRHPLAQKTDITLEDMEEETFLLHELGSTSRTLSDDWAAKVGLTWNRVMELGAIETIKEAIKCNMGIGILPYRSVRREIETGELSMKELHLYENRRYICLAYRDEEQLSPQVRAFITFLNHAMQGQPNSMV